MGLGWILEDDERGAGQGIVIRKIYFPIETLQGVLKFSIGRGDPGRIMLL